MEQLKSKNSLSKKGKETLVLLKLDGIEERRCSVNGWTCSEKKSGRTLLYRHRALYVEPCMKHLKWYRKHFGWKEIV